VAEGNHDAIDDLVAQWDRERPDLTFAAMGTVARLGRVAALVNASVEAVLVEHGLTLADFDVLATLRRSGAPHVLRPSDLSRQLLLSPAGMTGRLDRLAAAGLVDRTPDPDDRRSWLVGLTEEGRSKVDGAVIDHLANEERLLAALSPERRAAFDAALRELLAELD
jgi:DNA-binding MarR family transcriptional regulator